MIPLLLFSISKKSVFIFLCFSLLRLSPFRTKRDSRVCYPVFFAVLNFNIKDYEKINATTQVLIEQKEVLKQALENCSFVEKIYPSDANFILIKVDNANKRYDEFLEKGIVIRNRTNDDLCKNCLRITVGTEEENSKLIENLIDLSR